jgi:hypothetical protein
MKRLQVLAGLLSALLLGAGPPKPDPAPGAEEEVRAESPAPPVSLEQLLKLPPSAAASPPQPRRGGLTRLEWESRFRDARADLARVQESLTSTQKELEQTAAEVSNWQVTPPGQQAGSATSPVSYRLTQEIRRRREEVRASERRLQELNVQANLAGVPHEWRAEELPEGEE